MTHKDLKPRGIKPPLHLLPVGPLQAISACYGEAAAFQAPALEALPYGALCAAVSALHDGATKYQPWNWLERTPDEREVYVGAALRHVIAYNDSDQNDYASDSKVHHLAHAFATIVILMEKLQVPFELPLEGFDPDPDSSIMYRLLAFSHPTMSDEDESYGLHHLTIAGYLVLRELELEGIGYHESTAVQNAKGIETIITRNTELAQLVLDQAEDQAKTAYEANACGTCMSCGFGDSCTKPALVPVTSYDDTSWAAGSQVPPSPDDSWTSRRPIGFGVSS